MIGRCIGSTGADLGVPLRGSFYGAETVFHLEVGKEYILVGVGIFETVMLGLVKDETGRPNWLPVGLFSLEGSKLPPHWEFVIMDGDAASGGDAANRWVARWGYRELVQDDRHSNALIDRDPDALVVFENELLRRMSMESD